MSGLPKSSVFLSRQRRKGNAREEKNLKQKVKRGKKNYFNVNKLPARPEKSPSLVHVTQNKRREALEKRDRYDSVVACVGAFAATEK